MCEIEDGAIAGADRVREGLEGDGAEVVRKTFESSAVGGCLASAPPSTYTGRECILTSPLGVCDLYVLARTLGLMGRDSRTAYRCLD